MMMVPNVQVYPSPRSACQSCRATLDFVEALQTLSGHRPSGRGVAIDDLCKDIGDQRVE